jgi:hypothetical protein
MIPPALAKDQLKVVLDYAGFVPRRLRRDFLRTVARQLAGDVKVERAIGDALARLDAGEESTKEY